jgi:iron(III) transport system substrate-binding protein
VEGVHTMHVPYSKRSVFAVAVLVSALAAFVGASVGSAAHTSKIVIPPNPLKATIAQVAGLKIKGGFPNNPRDQKLLALAKAEGGQVNVYSSLSSFITKPLTDLWKQTFPDITLNFYRAGSEDVSARFVNESRAGTQNGADVVETNGTTMLIFQHDKNLLVPYSQTPWIAQIPKIDRFDTFVADRLEMFVIAYNKNLVSSPPKSFQDLTDPKWKGKLAMEPTDADWYAALYDYFTTQATPKMTGAQVDDMFKKIAANSQLIPSHSTEASALAAGQVQVVVTGHAQSMEQLMAKNAPIAFGPPFVTPVVQRPQGMGISYHAPHPAAAMLFYDFLISPLGQKMLQQNGVLPANPYFFDSAFKADPTLHIYRMDIRPVVQNWVAWNKRYNAIIQP